MRRFIVTIVLLTIAAPRSARCEEAGQILLEVMGISMLSPLMAVVMEGPLHIAAHRRETAVVPRPTAGRARMEATLPWREDAMTLARLDMGGYPGAESRFGWEGRSDIFAYRESHWFDGIQLRWDGLALYEMSPNRLAWSAEVLVGGTIWPIIGESFSWYWSGGVAGGLRVGTWTVRRVMRFEVEALEYVTSVEGCSGIQRILQLRAGFSIRVPTLRRTKPTAVGSAVGLTYLGMFPSDGSLLVPPSGALLFSASF